MSYPREAVEQLEEPSNHCKEERWAHQLESPRRLQTRPTSPPRRLRRIRRNSSGRSPLPNDSLMLRHRTRAEIRGKDIRQQKPRVRQKPPDWLPDIVASPSLLHSFPRLLGTTNAGFGSRTPLTSQKLDSSRCWRSLSIHFIPGLTSAQLLVVFAFAHIFWRYFILQVFDQFWSMKWRGPRSRDDTKKDKG